MITVRITHNVILTFPNGRYLHRPGVWTLPEEMARRLIADGRAVQLGGRCSEPIEPQGALGPSEAKPAAPGELKRLGGGWFELPDGRRVQGRAAAEQALKKDG